MINPRTLTAAVVILFAAVPAWAVTVTSGMTLYGSLETVWSSDLGRRYSQSFHPTAATPGDGATSPITPVDYEFAGESVAVSLAGMGLTGTMTVSTPPTGVVDGQLYHLNVVLSTPPVDYYGKGMGSAIDGSIYVSGGSSNQLHYGLRLRQSATGGGGSGNSHSVYANFNGTFIGNYNEQNSSDNFSIDSFGSTTVHTWSGGSVVNSPNGNGFVNLSFQPGAGHSSGGTGPGETTICDLWLTLSSTSVTNMPLVAPKLAVTSVTGGALNLSFPTQPWLTYVLEQATNLAPPIVWQANAPTYAGTGDILTLTNTIGTNAMGFFRIRIQ